MQQRQLDVLKNKRIYITVIFCIFFFFLLHGISREFPASGSIDFTNPLLEFMAVTLIYLIVFALFIVIWHHYIRKEVNLRRKRRLKLILASMVAFFIVTNVLAFGTNPVPENTDNNDNNTTNTSTSNASSTTSTQSGTETGSSETSAIKTYSQGTASPAPEIITLLDPRLIIIALALLFLLFIQIRRASVDFSEEHVELNDYEEQLSSEQLGRKKTIIKQYLSASDDLEMFGADGSMELTTREFEKTIPLQMLTKKPTLKPTLKELTRLYEEVKFSTHEITDVHVERAVETSTDISEQLFPQDEEANENSGNNVRKQIENEKEKDQE
ncbi:MAG: DUF4129 domain-containing protein [Candidatus Hodarchaeales archaeon]|jgi:uncharacterized protein YpmS